MKEAARKIPKSYRVDVDPALCDGCGICIFFCKPVVFELSRELVRRGVYPAVPVHNEACNNCGLCERACPQLAIRVLALERTGQGRP
jgi:2-oxoglutarate ferredoxin oxidoreductase subunit delta